MYACGESNHPPCPCRTEPFYVCGESYQRPWLVLGVITFVVYSLGYPLAASRWGRLRMEYLVLNSRSRAEFLASQAREAALLQSLVERNKWLPKVVTR